MTVISMLSASRGRPALIASSLLSGKCSLAPTDLFCVLLKGQFLKTLLLEQLRLQSWAWAELRLDREAEEPVLYPGGQRKLQHTWTLKVCSRQAPFQGGQRWPLGVRRGRGRKLCANRFV